MADFYRDQPAVLDLEPRVKDALARQHEGLQRLAIEKARELGADGRRFSSADLRRAGLPEPDHPNHWGSLISQLQTLKVIEYAGLRLEAMPSGGRKPVRVWRLTNSVETEPDAAA